MLNIIIGSPGSGKSYNLYTKLIEESIKNPSNRFVLFVPDQYSLEAQKEILRKHPKHGALNIEVSSFNRMAYEVLEEQGVSKLSMMDDLKKSIVVRKALLDCKDDLDVFRRKVNMPGFTDKVKSLISELGQYNITEDILIELADKCEKNTLKNKIEDVITIKNSVEKYIDDKSLTSEELMHRFIQAIPNSDIVANTYFFFDGFTGFTPIQIDVLSKLMANAKDVTVTVTLPLEQIGFSEIASDDLFFLSKATIRDLKNKAKEQNIKVDITQIEDVDGKPYRIKDNDVLSFVNKNIFVQDHDVYADAQSTIEVVESNSLENEVLAVARRISRLVKYEGYKYGDFAIICSDMEAYYKYLDIVFKKYDIPAFIDYKRNTSTNLFMDFIVALIRLAEIGFDYTRLFHLLRLGLSDICEEDLDYIENYIITMKRTSFNSFAHEWKKQMKGVDLERVNTIRKKIYELFKDFNNSIKESKTVGDYCRSIYKVISDWKIADQLDEYVEVFNNNNQLDLAEEYSQMYANIIRLLDTIYDALGSEEMDLEDFEKLVLSGIETLKIGVIPPGIDDVMVGDIERTRLKDTKKVLFLMGANEGLIPRESSTATIINDTDRQYLKKFQIELAPTTLENVYKQQFYLYMLMAKPTEQFVVSYSTKDTKGDNIKKSYLIDMILGLFKNLNITREYLEDTSLDDIYNEKLALEYLASKSFQVRNFSLNHDEYDIYRSIKYVLEKDERYKDFAKKVFKGTNYNYEPQFIDKELASSLYGDDSIKITRVQEYASCPYEQFLTYGLELKEREKYDFGSLDVGNIEHLALESFFKKVQKENIDILEESKENINKMMDDCLYDAIERQDNTYIRDESNGLFLKNQLANIAKQSVQVLIGHLKKGKFHVENMEDRGESGIVDRVDTYVTDDSVFVKVIDYKTGDKQFAFKELLSGLDMQVFVYLKDAMDREANKQSNKDKNIVPAGAYYFKIQNPYVVKDAKLDNSESNDSVEKRREKSFLLRGVSNIECLEELGISNGEVASLGQYNDNLVTNEQYTKIVSAVSKILGNMRNEIKTGKIKADPYKTGKDSCKYCNYKNICQIELSDSEGRVLESIDRNNLDEKLDKILED